VRARVYFVLVLLLVLDEDQHPDGNVLAKANG